ncbi:MAG: hypothetical protein J6S67_07165 [Methanobrevibacter sp.]|nr:hypothetical protein [Methanobrevibacter sp.]
MKRFLVIILTSSFLFTCCCFDTPTNTGDYRFSDSITISYDGFNSSLDNIKNINTTGTTIKLYGGSDSFENILFNFNNETFVKSISISFNDSLSLPKENCRFVILYNDVNILYTFSYSDITSFNKIQNIEINKNCNNIKLHFASNNSNKKTRTIKIHTVDFFLL